MTSAAGPYANLNVLEARDKFVKDLKQAGLIEKIEDIKNNISFAIAVIRLSNLLLANSGLLM